MPAIEYRIGWRYTRGKKQNHFISFVSLISVLGIAIGATVIITVLSIMNGFKEEIRERMLDMVSHATLVGAGADIDDWRTLKDELESDGDVVAAAPLIDMQGMLMNGDRVSGAYMHGVLPELEARVSNVAGHMESGSLELLEAGAFNAILGHALANHLRVAPGDRVTVVSPQTSVTPAGIIPRMRRFTVAGTFKSGLSQFDRSIALLHLEDARKLMRLDGAVSGVRLRLNDLFEAPRITRRLNLLLSPEYGVVDWTRSHSNFFRAIELEKLLMLIVMTLIIAVAAFNIISMLVMVVIEKRADIAILKTMGMAPRRIMKIFIVKGCLIGLAGNALGVAGGVALASHLERLVAAIERATGFRFLSPDVYPITEVPSRLLASDVVLVAGLTFVLTVLATIYPAWRAARIRPAEVLGES